MASDLIPFKVGEASPANTFFAIWMAQAAGLYEENRLDVDIVKMVGGSDTGPALSEGRVEDSNEVDRVGMTRRGIDEARIVREV